MFMMTKVRTKNSEEQIGFMALGVIMRTASDEGWKPKPNPVAYDRKDSRALSAALEKALKRLQYDIRYCKNSNAQLLAKMHHAELIEWFLCFSNGEAFKIQDGEPQEYKGLSPAT